MGFREYIVEKTRSYNREKRRGNTYSPPGAGVRQAGDWICLIGTLVFGLSPIGVFTLLTGIEEQYPGFYATFGPNGTLMLLVLVPLAVAVAVWASVLMGDWRSRLGTAVLGLAGTVLTWEIGQQFFGWVMGSVALPPNITLSGLSVGSVLILVGSVVATSGAYFSQWARRLGT